LEVIVTDQFNLQTLTANLQQKALAGLFEKLTGFDSNHEIVCELDQNPAVFTETLLRASITEIKFQLNHIPSHDLKKRKPASAYLGRIKAVFSYNHTPEENFYIIWINKQGERGIVCKPPWAADANVESYVYKALNCLIATLLTNEEVRQLQVENETELAAEALRLKEEEKKRQELELKRQQEQIEDIVNTLLSHHGDITGIDFKKLSELELKEFHLNPNIAPVIAPSEPMENEGIRINPDGTVDFMGTRCPSLNFLADLIDQEIYRWVLTQLFPNPDMPKDFVTLPQADLQKWETYIKGIAKTTAWYRVAENDTQKKNTCAA